MSKVLIIGGGIGGLCLAQGLRGAGVEVEVFERDLAPTSRAEGYRLHIDPAGARALHACLPEQLWSAFLATAGEAGGFGFFTEQLRHLVYVEESIMYPDATEPAENHYAADRATLRRVLLAGLSDIVRFGAKFERYERLPDGRVLAIFADGSDAVGDVLVGADGIGSRVRKQLLPQAKLIDAGVAGTAQKVWLDEVEVPGRLDSGMNVMLVDEPYFVFSSAFRPPRTSTNLLTELDGGPASDTRPYVLLALNARPDVLPENLTDLDATALAAVLDTLARGWHPKLRTLFAESDVDSRQGLRFAVSAPLQPWQPGNVTVLGDAIHAMPPIGGLGGNTALRDAHLLTRMLTAVDRGERELPSAIGYYESEMRDYGAEAIRYAMAEKDRSFGTGALGSLAARSFFRLCHYSPALRRRAFSRDVVGPSAPREWERDAMPVAAPR